MTKFITFSYKEYTLFAVSTIFLGLILGSFMFYLYESYKEDARKTAETMRFQGWSIIGQEKTDALKYVYNSEPYGDWVCVNIKGMSYDRAVAVCQHEAGHELFAQTCEVYPALCNETQALLSNYTLNRTMA